MKKIIFPFILFSLISVGAYAYQRYSQNIPSNNFPITTNTSQSSSTLPASIGITNKTGITMSQIATHSSVNDCWVAISGKTYDLTAFIPKHQGGAKAVIKTCGTDATNAFNAKSVHQQPSAAAVLVTYYIGNVQ